MLPDTARREIPLPRCLNLRRIRSKTCHEGSGIAHVFLLTEPSTDDLRIHRFFDRSLLFIKHYTDRETTSTFTIEIKENSFEQIREENKNNSDE